MGRKIKTEIYGRALLSVSCSVPESHSLSLSLNDDESNTGN